METVEYRFICNQANAFRVSELDDTLKILRNECADEISVVSRALLEGRVEKPKLHNDQHDSGFSIVTCTFEQADSIVEILFEAEASSISKTGEPTGTTSRLVSLVNKWSSFRESL